MLIHPALAPHSLTGSGRAGGGVVGDLGQEDPLDLAQDQLEPGLERVPGPLQHHRHDGHAARPREEDLRSCMHACTGSRVGFVAAVVVVVIDIVIVVVVVVVGVVVVVVGGDYGEPVGATAQQQQQR